MLAPYKIECPNCKKIHYLNKDIRGGPQIVITCDGCNHGIHIKKHRIFGHARPRVTGRGPC